MLATILYNVTKTDLSAPPSVTDCQCPRGKLYAFTTLEQQKVNQEAINSDGCLTFTFFVVNKLLCVSCPVGLL